MTEPEATKKTLKNVREKSDKLKPVKTFRASDFLTKDEQEELKRINAAGKKAKRKFDDVDAFVAEIIARFGWEVYQLWDAGKIENQEMQKWILAERSREKANIMGLYSLIYSTVTSCIKLEKGQKKPKGLKIAQSIIKAETKLAKGEF